MEYNLQARKPVDQTPDNYKKLDLNALDNFGFIDPAKSLVKDDAITLNKNFYPEDKK